MKRGHSAEKTNLSRWGGGVKEANLKEYLFTMNFIRERFY